MPAFLDVGSADCQVNEIEYVRLAWTATALGASFLEYDIDRTDDGGVTWDRVAEILLESIVTWSDYEARRGIPSGYRIRVVRTDGGASVWSTEQYVTPSAQNCELTFTTNVLPALDLAYQRGPDIQFGFPNAAEVALIPIYGRFGRVSLRPTEDRGVEFSIPVRVYSGTTAPVSQGVAGFDRIRALATAALPYVCILDQFGNRFLADLQVPDGTYTEPFARYIAEIKVAEVTDTPYIVSVTA